MKRTVNFRVVSPSEASDLIYLQGPMIEFYRKPDDYYWLDIVTYPTTSSLFGPDKIGRMKLFPSSSWLVSQPFNFNLLHSIDVGGWLIESPATVHSTHTFDIQIVADILKENHLKISQELSSHEMKLLEEFLTNIKTSTLKIIDVYGECQ